MLNHLIRLSKLFTVVSFPTTPTKIANYKSPLVPRTHLSHNFIHLIPLFLLLLKNQSSSDKKNTSSFALALLVVQSHPFLIPTHFFSFSYTPSKKSKKSWNPTRFDWVGCPTWSSWQGSDSGRVKVLVRGFKPLQNHQKLKVPLAISNVSFFARLSHKSSLPPHSIHIVPDENPNHNQFSSAWVSYVPTLTVPSS